MKKYDLLRSGDSIIRVLEIQDDRILVIDCIKHSMPVWVEAESLESYSECSERNLYDATGVVATEDIDDLDSDQRKIMHERYTMIAPILPFIADDKMRSRLICSVAEDHQVSKQMIRNYLCLYLSYLDVTVLIPKKREGNRELTQDEKHMRWALNKFFYTTKKQSLMTAYTMMLKEKQDVGTTGYAEKEKSQASDSFKRACFNWGIGRELYTAPFIWIPVRAVGGYGTGGQ